MVTKICKWFTMLCVSMAVICAQPLQILACGWDGDYDEGMYYSFFEYKEIGPKSRPAFYFYGWDLRAPEGGPKAKDNVQEWSEYFHIADSGRDVNAAIFTSTQQDLNELAAAIKAKKALPAKFKTNKVALFWKKTPADASLAYVQFAKRCEPHVTTAYGDEWGADEIERDDEAMGLMMEEGKKLYLSCKSEYIKLRYAFQVVRLAHYSGRYDEAVKLYDELVTNNKSKSIIRYRTMGHKAGALTLMSLGNADPVMKSQALALFAQVYGRVYGAKLLLYADLERFDADDYIAADKLIKEPLDRISLWQMAGIHTFPKFKALEKVYSVSPVAPEAEVLLARVMEDFQEHYTPPKYPEFDEGLGEEDLKQAAETIEKIAAAGNTLRPALWNMAAGFLSDMRGNYSKAAGFYSKNRKGPLKKNPELAPVQERLELLLKMQQWETSDLQEDSTLLLVQKAMKHSNKDIHIFTLLKLYELSEGMSSVLALYTLNSDYDLYNRGNFYSSLSPELVNRLLTARASKTKPKLEAMLWTISGLDEGTLNSFKAELFIRQHRFREAYNIYAKYKTYGNPDTKLPADPFVIHTNDCHDCDHADPNHKVYTRFQFISRMAELQSLITQPGSRQAEYCFLYANGLYNMSYYGNARDYGYAFYYGEEGNPSESGSENTGLNEGPGSGQPYYVAPAWHYDCREAMQNYVQAASLSSDWDFRAKSLFMAAKCEQNEFYNRGGNDMNVYGTSDLSDEEKEMIAAKNNLYRTHFKTLVQQYRQTSFYRQAIKECSYFRHYEASH